MPHILLIEDEPVFAATVGRFLENEGYSVAVGTSREQGLQLFAEQLPDTVLLDLRLPDADGLDVCRELRAASDVPIIILSTRDDDMVKVIGLELGADDYTTKNISPRELLARIRAVARRVGSPKPIADTAQVGDFAIDRRARTVTAVDGSITKLTQIEFDLLWYFLSNPGVVLRRERIFNDVWHQEQLGSSRTIDTHVVTLRNKISDLQVASIRGVGYRYDGGNT